MDDAELIYKLSKAGYSTSSDIEFRLSDNSLSRHLMPERPFPTRDDIELTYKIRLLNLKRKTTSYALRLANELDNFLCNLSITQDKEIEIVHYSSQIKKDGYVIFIGHPSKEVHGCCYVLEGGGVD